MSPEPTDKVNKVTSKKKAENKKQGMNLIKSLSDMTIYAPALNMSSANKRNRLEIGQKQSQNITNSIQANKATTTLPDCNDLEAVDQLTVANKKKGLINDDLIMKISDFVDQIQLDREENEVTEVHENRPKSQVNVLGLEEAQK